MVSGVDSNFLILYAFDLDAFVFHVTGDWCLTCRQSESVICMLHKNVSYLQGRYFSLLEFGTILFTLNPFRVLKHAPRTYGRVHAPTFIIAVSPSIHSYSYVKQDDTLKIFMAQSSPG